MVDPTRLVEAILSILLHMRFIAIAENDTSDKLLDRLKKPELVESIGGALMPHEQEAAFMELFQVTHE